MIKLLLVCILVLYAKFPSAHEQPLRVVTEHWAPFHYLDEVGELRGSAIDIVQKIISQAKFKANIEVLSWSKAYDLALNRPNTVIFSLIRAPERENHFHWYCPISEPFEISLFKLPNRNDIKLSQLDDAKRFTLGVVRNDYANGFLKSSGFSEGKNLVESTDELANLRQLFEGRIELVVQTKASIEYRLEKLGRSISDVEIALQSIDGKKLENCLALSKGSDEAIKLALDQAFADVSQTVKK